MQARELQLQEDVLVAPTKKSLSYKIRHKLIVRAEWQLYLLILPAVIYFILFHYVPMYGIQIAFRNYSITKAITEAP